MDDLEFEEFWNDLGELQFRNVKELEDYLSRKSNDISYEVKYLRSFKDGHNNFDRYSIKVYLKNDAENYYDDEIVFEEE